MYSIYFTKKAIKQYQNMDNAFKSTNKIDKKIKKLKNNPYPEGTKEKKKMKYYNIADYRIRTDGWRILYNIEKNKILIASFRKRNEKTYKSLIF